MRVMLLIPEGSQFLDFAGPAQVIETARLIGASYELHFVGTSDQRQTKMGLRFSGIQPLVPPREDDWIVVAGQATYDACTKAVSIQNPYVSDEEREWLATAFAAGARMSSVCSGAFALGEAGILDNHRATTHWLGLDQFRTRFPLTKVVENVLFVDDGQVITSAGVAASIDMTLHLVARDHGPRMALHVTRGLVINQRRAGVDEQLSAHLSHRGHPHTGVHRVQDWLSQHVDEPATLDDLARVARMSVRSLTREFRAATGLTILEFRERLRLENAQDLASRPDLTLEEVAYRCGFGGSRQLRRVWRKHHGAQPLRRAARPKTMK
jgi:transcriptional regulator GlxA family with amidase domain